MSSHDLTLTADYQASLDFLNYLRPAGDWVLVAIHSDRKMIDGATFGPDTVKELRAWLERMGKDRNIYFTLNPTRFKLNKKPTRADIKAMEFLHVDLDPEGEAKAKDPAAQFKAERDRIFKLLQEPIGGIPDPTFVIDSGGGYQAFWRLEEPLALDGSSDQYEDAKRYNQQIELTMGGDHCHNIDRILRLPGTVNRPDPKKRKKGRKPALASLAYAGGPDYALSRFTQAPVIVAPNQRSKSTSTVEVSGNARRFDSLDDLPDTVPDKCKAVINLGYDPDDPLKFDGRSEWLFYACCEMKRNEVSDDDIYSIITDPDFGISKSVLDKGAGSERYALRQIERARDRALAPELLELNDRYAFVEEVGGRARIMSFGTDPVLKQQEIIFQLPDGFRLSKSNRKMQVPLGDGKTTSVPLGRWWLSHPQRRTYSSVVFAPGLELPSDVFNLWQGFGVVASPGDCQLFLEHLKGNLCRGNEAHYMYLLRWMAHAVQEPQSQGHVAVVLHGRKGTGKSFFAKQFGKLWGRHFRHITNPDHLVGKFNAMLMDGALIFADEAFFAGNPRHAQALKTLVTEDRITIELKGLDMKNWPNCTKLIMASNEDWIVRATVDERRFFVLDVGDNHMQDRRYFSRIVSELEAGGYEALLHLLLNMDLRDFDVTQVPRTEALCRQMSLTLGANPRAEWLLYLLRDGILPNTVPGIPRAAYSMETVLGVQDGLYDHARKVVPELRGRSNEYLSRAPREIGAQNLKPHGAGRYWQFPPLKKARAMFESTYGAQDWPDGGDDDWSTIGFTDFEDLE